MTECTLAGTRLDPYYHVCAFFNSEDEEYDVISPFVVDGVKCGDKSLHIVDPAGKEAHMRALAGRGIDVDECIACGKLEVLGWSEAYLAGGTFEPDRMLSTVEAAHEAGVKTGFPRLRVIGKMDWAFQGLPGTEQVIEYEARVNEVLVKNRQPAVCVYDLKHLSGTMMMDILRSHPLTLIGGVVHENPLYTPPNELLRELHRRSERLRQNGASVHRI